YPTGSGPVSVAVGDFDGDGDPDLATANFNADTVSVLLGGAGASFGAKTDYATGGQPNSVTVGDFDGDNDPDLAIANYNASTVSILLGAPVPAPQFSVSPGSNAYGNQLVGSTSGAQTFTVTNTGTANLAVTTAALAGTDP